MYRSPDLHLVSRYKPADHGTRSRSNRLAPSSGRNPAQGCRKAANVAAELLKTCRPPRARRGQPTPSRRRTQARLPPPRI